MQTVAEHLVENIGFPYKDAWNIIEQFFEQMNIALEKGESVRLTGFGNFKVRHKHEMPGRNPKRGEAKMIGARSVVTFRPGEKLTQRIST